MLNLTLYRELWLHGCCLKVTLIKELLCIIKILNNEEGIVSLIQGPSFRLRGVVKDILFL